MSGRGVSSRRLDARPVGDAPLWRSGFRLPDERRRERRLRAVRARGCGPNQTELYGRGMRWPVLGRARMVGPAVSPKGAEIGFEAA